ncbi:MAG: hypothetical protein O3C39_01720 [Planctomycetota bacterium]|jgi:hypothetical protein|nr:hypothetical protein [Pirellulales bacterium]MDA0253254.1 hypothetical protein [Planctomycetota bacterium]MDA1200380.1 hypothetical protein [Planctomycetota bacterium]
MIISLILLGIFIAVAFAIWREGPWSGLIMLLNLLLAASLATAWYPFVVALIEPRAKSYTYLLDFVVLQGLFCLLLLGFREVTDRASRTRVRFRKPVELAAGPLVAVITAWVMVCFTAASLHTAPLPRDFIQPTPESRMFFGLAPDRRWLAWVRGSSRDGPFATPAKAFDPEADFILRYASRRSSLEQEPALRVQPQ